MKKKLITLLTLSALIIPAVKAQYHPNTPQEGEIKIMVGDKNNSPSVVYKILLENLPVTPQYNNLPRFSIVGKENKFYLGIGASIKGTASFDWGNPLGDPSLFIPSALTPSVPGNGGKFQMTAKQSQIYFNAVALPGTENQIGVYIGLYFAGNNYSVILNNAYLKYRGFTIGYKFTMYCDMAASPYTIDTEGANSSPSFRNTVLNYEHNFTPKIKAGIGLELPMTSITNTDNTIIQESSIADIISKTNNVTQRIPDIPLYVQYKWKTNGNGHVRLTGVLRNMQYRNINQDKNQNSFGWGIKISGLAEFGKITTYWMAQGGKGIASYLQDNTGMGLDMVPSIYSPGELQNTKSWGAYGGIQYNFSKKLFSSLVYSHVRNYMNEYNGGAILYDNQYQWGQYILGNIIWNITPNVQTGIEYIYGRKMDMNQTQIHDNRLSAMMQVSF